MQIDRILGNVGVLYVGAYNSSKQYEYLNCVTYDGSSYVCVNQNGVIGVTPGTTDDWQLSAKKGDMGPVGPKPVNGVDYNTDEEKEEFKNDVVSKATEEVEKNIADIETEAIENYNKNATQKTTEYNTNANTQVESFNANATSKTNDFNSNASTKTEEFNTVVDAEKEQFAGQTEAINHHIAVVSDELERVKNDVLETGEESGSYITLNDSAMAEYQELSVDGVCEQETTKMTYKCTGEESGDYYFTYNDINYQFTMPTITSSSILVFDTSTLKLTLNSTEITTSTGTAGTLLTFLNTPNPNYPQEIKTIENSLNITSCNKNLIPYMEKGEIDSTTGEEVDSTTVLRSGFIKAKPNTNYISSYNNNEINVTFYSYNKNKQKVGNVSFKSKFTTGENVEYIRIRIYNNNYDTSFFQVEQSNNATSLVEHLQSQIEVNLPEGEFIGKLDDTYKDTLKVEYNEENGEYHLVLNKMLAKFVLTNDFNNGYVEKSSDYNVFIFKMWDFNDEIGNSALTKCNYYESKTSYNSNCIWNIYNGNIWIINEFDNTFTEDMTTEEAKTKFHDIYDNKLYFYYPLKKVNQYTVDLGIVDMPITYDDVTNLFTDSDLMPIINAKYYRNFTKTIADLQVNNKSLLEELTELENKVTTLESNNADLESRVLALENKEISTTSLESEVK